MKALPILLAASLLANTAWLVTHGLRSSTTAPESSVSPGAADLLVAIQHDDAEAVRDALRQGGVADKTVRIFVSSFISSRYTERENALYPPPDPTLWWKQDIDTSFETMLPAQHVEMRRIQREAKNEIARLLGPDPDDPNWLPHAARLTYLSHAKHAAVREIEEAYDSLTTAVSVDMHGFPLPSDDEKLHRLKDEKQRAIAAALTPEEIAEYELRMSPLAETLRRQLPLFDPSESEFRQIFALKQASLSSTEFQAQLKASLGTQRYADYRRAHDSDYQKLAAIVRRLHLPSDNAAVVHTFKHAVSAEALRIADTASLTLAEKKAKIAELAQHTRTRAHSLLGDGEAARIYAQNHMSWLNDLEAGRLTSYTEYGHSSGYRNLNTDPSSPSHRPNP